MACRLFGTTLYFSPLLMHTAAMPRNGTFRVCGFAKPSMDADASSSKFGSTVDKCYLSSIVAMSNHAYFEYRGSPLFAAIGRA